MLRRFWLCLAVALLTLPTAAMAQEGVGSASTAFQWDVRGVGGLYSHTPSDPLLDWTFLGGGATGTDPSWIAMDADSSGQLFAVDINTNFLGMVDSTTAEFTDIAALSGVFPAVVQSMIDEFDVCYISDGIGLWTCDLNTGVCVQVAAAFQDGINPVAGVFGMASDGAGNYYAFSIDTDSLYELDETNGNLTLIALYNGPPGRDGPNFSNNGMDWDPVSGQLIGAVYTGGGTGSYGTRDVTTGGGSTGFTEILNNDLYPAPYNTSIGGPIACFGGTTFHQNFWSGGILCTYDTLNPLSNFIDIFPPAIPDLFAIDFDDSDGTLYAADTANVALGTLSTVDGSYTQLLPLTGDFPAAGGTIVAISYDASTGGFYLANTTSLFTLDINTGATVFVADFVGEPLAQDPNVVIAMSIDTAGNMFIFDIGNDILFSVDKTTGISTVLGTAPGNAGFVQGMDFDPTDDTLYASIYVSGGTGFYGTWDTTTGAFTTITLLENLPPDVDGYELMLAIRENSTGPVTVSAASVTTTRGTYVSGGLAEIIASDNADYRVSRNNADTLSRTEITCTSTSPTQTPTSIEVTVEGAVFARSNVVQTIEVFDYTNGVWVAIDSRNANRSPQPDLTVTAAVVGTLADFVNDADGEISARVRYQSDNRRQNFTSNTDLLEWTIE